MQHIINIRNIRHCINCKYFSENRHGEQKYDEYSNKFEFILRGTNIYLPKYHCYNPENFRYTEYIYDNPNDFIDMIIYRDKRINNGYYYLLDFYTCFIPLHKIQKFISKIIEKNYNNKCIGGL